MAQTPGQAVHPHAADEAVTRPVSNSKAAGFSEADGLTPSEASQALMRKAATQAGSGGAYREKILAALRAHKANATHRRSTRGAGDRSMRDPSNRQQFCERADRMRWHESL